MSYASHSKLHLRLYLFWQILPRKCNKLSFQGISIQARCNPNEDDDDAVCGFLCTAGLDTLRGSSCLWRLRGQGWCVWPWKQRSLHKSIDPMGIWACHHFFSLLSERWCHDQLNYLKPSSLLRCFWKLILTEHVSHEGMEMRADCRMVDAGDNTGGASPSWVKFSTVTMFSGFTGPSVSWLHKKGRYCTRCWLLLDCALLGCIVFSSACSQLSYVVTVSRQEFDCVSKIRRTFVCSRCDYVIHSERLMHGNHHIVTKPFFRHKHTPRCCRVSSTCWLTSKWDYFKACPVWSL